MEVTAAGDQQFVAARELPQPRPLVLVVLAVIDLDAVETRLDQGLQQRQRQVVVPGDRPGWARTETPLASRIARTADSGEGA